MQYVFDLTYGLNLFFYLLLLFSIYSSLYKNSIIFWYRVYLKLNTTGHIFILSIFPIKNKKRGGKPLLVQFFNIEQNDQMPLTLKKP